LILKRFWCHNGARKGSVGELCAKGLSMFIFELRSSFSGRSSIEVVCAGARRTHCKLRYETRVRVVHRSRFRHTFGTKFALDSHTLLGRQVHKKHLKSASNTLFTRNVLKKRLRSASGPILELLEHLLGPPGALGALLGASWPLPGRSGRAPTGSWGPSWGTFGTSWAALGSLWGPPTLPEASENQFWFDLEPVWHRFALIFGDTLSRYVFLN
jgi:hypothetical protein